MDFKKKAGDLLAHPLFSWVVMAVALFLALSFPFSQIFQNNGLVFYQNAYDESFYLAFEGSVSSHSVTRLSQFLVTFLHYLGLSGGWQNLIFDFIFIFVTMWMVWLSLEKLEKPVSVRLLGALMVIFLPVFFGRTFYEYGIRFNENLYSGRIFWFSMPEAYFPPFFRSPEPQFSWMIFSIAAYFSFKIKSIFPALLVTPFLYSFIALPLMFFMGSLLILKYVKVSWVSIWPVMVVSFFGLSLLTLIYFEFVAGPSQKEAMVLTHKPMGSYTFIISALIYLGIYFQRGQKYKKELLILVCSIPFVQNLHLISGVMIQPNNFEQYYGVVVISVLSLFFVSGLPMKEVFISLLTLALLYLPYRYGKLVIKLNINTEKLTQEHVLDKLRTFSSRVAFNDFAYSRVAGMIFPKQPMTVIDYGQTYGVVSKTKFNGYLCFKEYVKEKGEGKQFEKIFKTLDKSYSTLNRDFILSHVGRKQNFKSVNNPDQKARNCSKEPYFLFQNL